MCIIKKKKSFAFNCPLTRRYAEKMNMKPLIIILFFLTTQANAEIAEGGKGMLFGDNHTFTFTAKEGWVLDNQSGVNRGIHMVFYPKDKTWSNSPVIIYGRASPTNEIATINLQVKKQ